MEVGKSGFRVWRLCRSSVPPKQDYTGKGQTLDFMVKFKFASRGGYGVYKLEMLDSWNDGGYTLSGSDTKRPIKKGELAFDYAAEWTYPEKKDKLLQDYSDGDLMIDLFFRDFPECRVFVQEKLPMDTVNVLEEFKTDIIRLHLIYDYEDEIPILVDYGHYRIADNRPKSGGYAEWQGEEGV